MIGRQVEDDPPVEDLRTIFLWIRGDGTISERAFPVRKWKGKLHFPLGLEYGS